MGGSSHFSCFAGGTANTEKLGIYLSHPQLGSGWVELEPAILASELCLFFFFFFFFGTTHTHTHKSVFLHWRSRKESSPYTGPYSVAASCFTGWRQTLRKWQLFGKIQVELLCMLWWVEGMQWSEKLPHTLHLASDYVLKPWGQRKCHFHSCFLGLLTATWW